MIAEGRYQDFFESMPATLYVSNADGVLLEANQAMVDMLGYPDLETLLGTNVQDHYVHPSARATWLEEVVREGVVRGGEEQLRRFDGSVIWVRETARLMDREDDGTPVFQGTLEDITQQKAAEEALRESQRTLATLFSNLPGMAYRCANDADLTMDFVSQGCRELTGYPPAALLGNTEVAFADLIHADDRELVSEDVQAALAAHRPFLLQYRIRDAEGRVKWVSDQGRGLFSEDGELMFLEGFIADVSERWRAEQEVRDSEAWYRTLFESAMDAILLMEGDRFIDCNSRTMEMFRCTADSMIGSRFDDVSPPRQPDGRISRERAEQWIQEALGGEPQFFEWRYRRADDELFEAEVGLTRVSIKGRTFLQAIVRDVTQRKRTERALQRRDEILQAVGFAAAKSLQGPAWSDLANEVLGHLGRAADASRVYLLEACRGHDGELRLQRRHSWQVGDESPPEATAADDGLSPDAAGIARWLDAISVGEVIQGTVADLPEPERGFLSARDVLSVVVVPVSAGGELWGLLGVDDCREEREWSKGEIEAISAAADILGGAVYLDRARRAVETRTQELDILYQVNSLLATTLDARSVMQAITDIVCTRCAVDHVSVALVDDDRRRLDFVAWSGYDAPQRDVGLDIDGPGLVAAAVRRSRPMYASDVGDHDAYLCADKRVRAEYALPLEIQGEILGVLNCESFELDGIGPWQRGIIDRLASQAAVALRNAEIVRRLEGAAG